MDQLRKIQSTQLSYLGDNLTSHIRPQFRLLKPPVVCARAANLTATGAASSKAHYVAREDDTSRAGAVYVFSRLVVPATGSTEDASTASSSSPSSATPTATTPVCSESDDSGNGIYSGQQPEVRRFYCPRGGERGQPYCGWEESAKLTATDRRGGDLFGRCLSVDHDSGVVVVGAPGASLTGLWREVRIRGGGGKFSLPLFDCVSNVFAPEVNMPKCVLISPHVFAKPTPPAPPRR